MAACGGCGREIEASFRFCPWCAAPQRRKLVEFFRPHPRDAGRALRVSRYFGDEPQVRFSVWDDGTAQAAVSLEDAEARRMAAFVAATTQPPSRVAAGCSSACTCSSRHANCGPACGRRIHRLANQVPDTFPASGAGHMVSKVSRLRSERLAEAWLVI